VAFTPDRKTVLLVAGARGGDEVQAVRLAAKGEVLQAVVRASRQLKESAGQTELELVLSHSCALRSFYLGDQARREDEVLREQLQPRHHVTLLAIGEVATSAKRDGTPLHRFTTWASSAVGLA
jgi:hypothetical protein